MSGERLATLAQRRCVVTGGAGFIGSHIAQGLLEHGAEVAVLDDLSSGHAENVPAGARFVRGSILEEGALRKAMEGAEVVFHEAAMVSVPQSVDEPERCLMVNVVGTQRVLEAARAAGARRLIFAASSAAYGDQPTLPSREDDPVAPASPYAMSKLAGEQLLAVWARVHGLEALSLRYFNVFGPRQDPRSPYAAVISAFAARLAEGERPVVFGDGLQSRDFVPVEDVVRANLLAATAPRAWSGEVVNIGTGESLSLLDLLERMCRIAGVASGARHEAARAGDVRHSRADIGRAKSLLGYEPRASVSESLEATMRWMDGALAVGEGS